MKRRRERLGRVLVDVVPERTLTRDSFLLCGRRTIPLQRPENRIAPCAHCGDELQYHPSSPTKPLRLCADCMRIALLRSGEAPPITVTQTQFAVIGAMLKEES